MPIVCLVGGFGEGKTLFMSVRGWRRYKMGHRVLANYGVRFPHEKLNGARLVQMGADLQDCVILGDEFHVILDSRLGMKGENIATTYFILQTRKRNVYLYITTQDFDQVDKRLRRHVDYLVYCERVVKRYRGADGKVRIVKTHKYRYRIFKRTKHGMRYLKTVEIDGRKFYKLYNTRETITDFKVGQPQR